MSFWQQTCWRQQNVTCRCSSQIVNIRILLRAAANERYGDVCAKPMIIASINKHEIMLTQTRRQIWKTIPKQKNLEEYVVLPINVHQHTPSISRVNRIWHAPSVLPYIFWNETTSYLNAINIPVCMYEYHLSQQPHMDPSVQGNHINCCALLCMLLNRHLKKQ